MALTVIHDPSPNEFLEQAGPLLYREEPSNSLMLGLCGNILRSKESPKVPPLFIRILKDARTVSAAVRTHPISLVITFAKTEEIEFLAKHLQVTGAELPGVVGPAKESETFSTIWSQQTGKIKKLGMNQKIYKIENVIIPNTLGQLRLAQIDEADLIAQWLVEFADESLLPSDRKSFEERLTQAVKAIDNQFAYVWLVDETPVSMAHLGRPTQNGISISAVYTPKHMRKKGYGSAIVAHLSQKMLDSGKKFCVLYTDLSNPTSNKIYQNIGYQEVADSKYFLFEDRNV